MATREEALEFMHRLRSCRAESFFGKMDQSQRGIGFVLIYLQKTDGRVIAGDLAGALNVSTARIAALLKKMEKNGLIIRYHSPADARQTVVEITQKGIDYADEMREQVLAKVERLLDAVGREDLEEFIRISYKIKNALGE